MPEEKSINENTQEYFDRLGVRVKAWEKKQGRNITLRELNIIAEKMMYIKVGSIIR